MSLKTLRPQTEPQPHKAQRREREVLAETILKEGQAQSVHSAAEVAAALAVGRAELTDAELAQWRRDMEQRLEEIQHHPEQNLGFIEEALARGCQEPLRLLAQRAAQAKANATPCQCPRCRVPLHRVQVLRRWIDSRFGRLQIYRGYGWCPECQTWSFPADLALGLNKNSPASPYLQEVSALLNTKMPSEQAAEVARRFGLELSRCFLHREAHRQGLKAEQVRQIHLSQLDTWEQIQALALAQKGAASAPFTLVIEIDAWNIRERDDWGRTEPARQEALRQNKEAPSKWHWVYVATVFRLDHRGQTARGRPMISQRGYVCTRLGIDDLMRQLYRQSIDCGLGHARDVLVIADGAVWIWKAVKDRFPDARTRLDLYHADEHLWTIAHELYGKDTPEARQWVEPLLKRLHQDKPAAVIQSLKDVAGQVKDKLQEKVQAQITYFENNQNRINYRAILAARKAVKKGTATPAQQLMAAEPLGSGAIESTCRQYQCRFKRPGQFWSMEGDEALLCLETFWRNGRWHDLFPHAQPPSLANN
jgi:exonuclease VII large subunit